MYRFALMLAAAVLPWAAASAQTLRVVAQVSGAQSVVTAGGTVVVPTEAPNNTASFSITNLSSASVTISQILLSSTDFVITTTPVLPLSLAAGATTSFGVRYAGVTAPSLTPGQVSIQYTDAGVAK